MEALMMSRKVKVYFHIFLYSLFRITSIVRVVGGATVTLGPYYPPPLVLHGCCVQDRLGSMMAQDRIVLDLARSSYNYRQFIRNLRERARDPHRYSHNLPILPFPPKNPQNIELITVELRATQGVEPLLVLLRRDNLYLIGFRMQNGVWYEFPRDDNYHLIQGSEYLPFGESYIEFGGLEPNSFQVGYNPLINAINNLRVTWDNDERRRSFRILCVMLCEATRFDMLFQYYAPLIELYDDKAFTGWEQLLIHSWGYLSNTLLEGDDAAVPFHLAPGPDGSPNPLTENPLYITSAHVAVACLGLLVGTYRPKPSTLLFQRLPNINALLACVGSPMVEVFSVYINDIDGEDPGDLYGTIQVVDGLGDFYLYNRSRSEYESIRPNQNATLVGPYRAISAASFFTIILDLKDKDSDPSPDDEVSKGYVTWNLYTLYTTINKFNKPLSNVIHGKYGQATMYYAILDEALEASIQIILINGDDEDPADVYGTIVARYKDDFFKGSDLNEKEFYKSTLFNKNPTNVIQVRPGNNIPLLRSVVAVPLNSSITIEALLKDYDFFSFNDEIANGTAEFWAAPFMPTEQEINGKYGKIKVQVSWSPLSGGNLV